MFHGKMFKDGKNTVAALCDQGLVGKEIKSERFNIKISEGFYGKDIVDEERALNMMKECTIGNLIGKRIVGLARKHGFITEENIISIDDIPHAQFVM